MTTNNILDLKTSVKSLKSPSEHSLNGKNKVDSNPLGQKEDTDDSSSQTLKRNSKGSLNLKNKTFVTVESPLPPKKKIWKDKLSTSNLDTLTTELSGILDRALTLKEKGLTPFSIPQSKEISEHLWLPTEIDCVDSVLSSSKDSLRAPMGNSWFSIKNKLPQKKNSLMTSFQLSRFSLPNSLDSDPTPSRKKSETKLLKTIKIRLFPTKKEKGQLKVMFEQFRWYYNATVNIVYNHYGYKEIDKVKKYSNFEIDKIIRNYEYIEELHGSLYIMQFVRNESINVYPKPIWLEDGFEGIHGEWIKENVHNRIPRGAINKFTYSLNSAITNKRNGNIKDFKMDYMRKKKPIQYLHFGDYSYPVMFKKIKSRYWYTTKDKKRKCLSFSDIESKRGFEIINEKETGRYFLHLPIEVDWYPEDDKRNDSQVKYVNEGDRIISLDPGVRKFMVGYDPTGKTTFFGEGACKEILKLLLEIDEDPSYVKWKKIKDMVKELHWKTISYLIENYDVILLPDFRVSEMLKGKKLARSTKRQMSMFSFYSFKEKLKYKCKTYNKKLIIVDESYTSCTCGSCFKINQVKGNETYNCKFCKLEIDRDVQGSRNILIKNITLRSRENSDSSDFE
jgi:IS605 OrfB family transposase